MERSDQRLQALKGQPAIDPIEQVAENEAEQEHHVIPKAKSRAWLTTIDHETSNAPTAQDRRKAMRDGSMLRVIATVGFRQKEIDAAASLKLSREVFEKP